MHVPIRAVHQCIQRPAMDGYMMHGYRLDQKYLTDQSVRLGDSIAFLRRPKSLSISGYSRSCQQVNTGMATLLFNCSCAARNSGSGMWPGWFR